MEIQVREHKSKNKGNENNNIIIDINYFLFLVREPPSMYGLMDETDW